jgi:hypothetical protein
VIAAGSLILTIWQPYRTYTSRNVWGGFCGPSAWVFWVPGPESEISCVEPTGSLWPALMIDHGLWYLSMPYWLMMVCVGLPTGFLWWRDRRRRPLGHCQQCGYDLTGNVSGRCPECGEDA